MKQRAQNGLRTSTVISIKFYSTESADASPNSVDRTLEPQSGDSGFKSRQGHASASIPDNST